MNNIITILWILSISTPLIDSYRILGIFPLHAKSHHVMFSAVIKELINRGHQVDEITHFPLKNAHSNYTVAVNLDGTLDGLRNTFTVEETTSVLSDCVNNIGGALGNEICKILLASDKFQQFFKKLQYPSPYDVVLTEAFGAHCFMGIGHLLKVPVVAITSSAEYPWMSNFLGNYDLAVIPNILLTSFDRNNFWDRLNNVVTHYWYAHDFYAVTEIQTEYMRKYISPDIPSIRKVEKNVALTLINRHPLMVGAKAVTPSLIEVGGLHIEENDDVLDESLKKWLDSSKYGVVYFTLGSLVLIESFPLETMKEIYKFFDTLVPMRVLMKVTDRKKLPPGLPRTVRTMPWTPQQAVLAHKNVRVFLTHGGMMGCQEALYYGVPIIGIPLFADQSRNIAPFVEKNIAIKLDLNNITNVSLSEAFNEILSNPKYRENAKFHSKIFKDRPMSPMETAVFWIEYVIRNGPEVLRSPGQEMPWWQIALIDVYGFIFLSFTVVFALIYCILKKLLSNCFFILTRKNKFKQKLVKNNKEA